LYRSRLESNKEEEEDLLRGLVHLVRHGERPREWLHLSERERVREREREMETDSERERERASEGLGYYGFRVQG